MYRTIWRWHFYAGLFVLPFVITLALSGTVFLFKPQIESWEERAYRALPTDGAVAPSQQVGAALAAFPGAQFHSYRLPAHVGDAALVHLTSAGRAALLDVFVSPQGTVVGSLDSDKRIVEVARRLHSQLLMGTQGSWLVELAACWAIVMLGTGLYLWWPRGRGMAGVIWPRHGSMLRDLHAVTGFWISSFALVLLLTGMPWSQVWGSAFRAVRAEMGWVKGPPQWSTGDHPAHDAAALSAEHSLPANLVRLDAIVARTSEESLAYPAVILAPGAELFGAASTHWTLTSMTQNRPLGQTITFDSNTGDEISRERFAERHPIDRVIGYGQAWHEGALFGVANQVLGVLTTIALVTLSITGFLMWRRRRPTGSLGAPALPTQRRIPLVITAVTLLLALLLPLLAASLLVLWVIDRLLPRLSSRFAAWLGIAPAVCIAFALALSLGTAPAQAAQESEAPLDTVIVTAERIRDEIQAERAVTPGAVTTLDAEKLNERNVTQLADLLRYVPGVWAESYNGNDDVFYSSRGSNLDATDYDKNGVKFLQDGLPVTTADGNNHNRALDPLGARYITIAHGANALAYGASTLGGAVDFTSPTAHNLAPFNASLGGGSFGQWNARATLGGVANAFDGLITAETVQRDGYREHSKEDRKSIFANAGWQASENIAVRLYANYSDFYAELPRELTPSQFAANPRQARADAIAGNHSKKVKAWRLAFKTTVAEMAGGTLEVGASHEEQSLYHPIVSTPFFSLLIDTDHKDSGAMLRYRRSMGDHNLIFGGNYGYSTVKGGNYQNVGGKSGFLMWTTDNTASALELFALDRWKFAPAWTLVYGTQFTATHRKVDGFKASYDSFNPRLGVIREVAKGSEWFASASRSYEAPTTFELTDDANGGTTPLAAMHGLVYETGFRGTSLRERSRLNWEIAAYYTRLRNEILSIDSPTAPGTSLSKNIDRTQHAGIEALLGASIAVGTGKTRIEPLLNFTYNAFKFSNDSTYGNNHLPSAPRYFLRGEMLYRHVNGIYAGPTFDLIGQRYVDFANTYGIKSYALLGARAGFNAEHWELYAEARNLTNMKYVATVVVKDKADAGMQMLFPGAPRSVYFGARYRFQ